MSTVEQRFRLAISRAFKPSAKPTEPLKDVLAAFKTVLKQDVDPDAALMKEVAMDSLDLMEVTTSLDEIYGDIEWEPFFEGAMTRFAMSEHPALTARMIAEYIRNIRSISPAA